MKLYHTDLSLLLKAKVTLRLILTNSILQGMSEENELDYFFVTGKKCKYIPYKVTQRAVCDPHEM